MSSLIATLAQARAKMALEDAGLVCDGKILRASSTNNEVFITDEYVIKLSRIPETRLRREAMLCKALPDFDWLPILIAHGQVSGADYLIIKRQPGQPLSRHWYSMSHLARREAISQLAEYLQQLHATAPPANIPMLSSPLHMLFPNAPAQASVARGIRALLAEPNVDQTLLENALTLLEQVADSLPVYQAGSLIHGDLSFENILWDGSKISAIIDFEWCRPGPPDLDLDVILRFCAIPENHAAEDYRHEVNPADYEPIPTWLAQDYPEMFSSPRIADRLTLYALSYEVNSVLRTPPDRPTPQLDPVHPYNRLNNLVTTGGHLPKIFDLLGLEHSLNTKFSSFSELE